jgi:hypothetical protein
MPKIPIQDLDLYLEDPELEDVRKIQREKLQKTKFKDFKIDKKDK